LGWRWWAALLFEGGAVVPLPGGFTAKVRGKMESPSIGDALQPKEKTRVAEERHSSVELGF
jgi:hypothetical protein